LRGSRFRPRRCRPTITSSTSGVGPRQAPSNRALVTSFAFDNRPAARAPTCARNGWRHVSAIPDSAMYRRPLPSANLAFLTAVMWDGREPDLSQQANDATVGHAQGTPLTADQRSAIVAFETLCQRHRRSCRCACRRTGTYIRRYGARRRRRPDCRCRCTCFVPDPRISSDLRGSSVSKHA
jgi:hypothetical protein